MDTGKTLTGAAIMAAGFLTPIPVIDDVLGILIGGPIFLSGLGQEEAAEKLEDKT